MFFGIAFGVHTETGNDRSEPRHRPMSCKGRFHANGKDVVAAKLAGIQIEEGGVFYIFVEVIYGPLDDGAERQAAIDESGESGRGGLASKTLLPSPQVEGFPRCGACGG